MDGTVEYYKKRVFILEYFFLGLVFMFMFVNAVHLAMFCFFYSELSFIYNNLCSLQQYIPR